MLKKETKKQFHLEILLMIVLICVISIIPSNYALAADFKIKYDGKTITYTKAQTKITLDGKKVDFGKNPGIIIDDVCMVPAKEVFEQALGASYVFDEESGAFSIKQHNVVVSMTIGSKKAYVNGNQKTLSVAPKKVKFFHTNQTKVMVPFRFVAESLGYSYSWSKSESTSKLTSPLIIRYKSNYESTELSEDDWVTYTGTKGKLHYNGAQINLSDIPVISIDGTNLVQVEEVFGDVIGLDYSYNTTAGIITLRRNDIKITMTLNSRDVLVNDVPYEMNTEVRLVENKKTQNSYIMAPIDFLAKHLGYTYSWNSSDETAVIKRTDTDYTHLEWNEDILTAAGSSSNMVTNIDVYNRNKNDIVTITGLSALTAIVSEDNSEDTITIDVLNVFNQIDEVQKSFTDGLFINGVKVKPSGNGISIILMKEATGTYYTSQSGNTFEIVMCENSTINVQDSSYEMKFSLPDGVTIEDITDEDLYHENKFILTLPGNYLDYFSENPISYNTSIVKNVTVSLNSAKNTQLKVQTKKLQGYKLNDCIEYIGVTIDNPSKVYKKIVVLDAGHGGKDGGATKSSTKEKTLNYNIIYKKAKEYFNSTDSDIKAYWTRTTDTYVDLNTRAAFAEKVEADIFISLHMNSATSTTGKGLEVLYASNNKNEMSEMDSKKMAKIFQDQLIADLKMTDRGIKDRVNLVVLKKNVVPAVLIELGFMSNSSDFKKLSNSSFQEKAAESIYKATQKCFNAYPTGR